MYKGFALLKHFRRNTMQKEIVTHIETTTISFFTWPNTSKHALIYLLAESKRNGKYVLAIRRSRCVKNDWSESSVVLQKNEILLYTSYKLYIIENNDCHIYSLNIKNNTKLTLSHILSKIFDKYVKWIFSIAFPSGLLYILL